MANRFLATSSFVLFALLSARSIRAQGPKQRLDRPPSVSDGSVRSEATPECESDASGQSSRAIQWSVLAPENGKPFIDPFARLSNDQISDLGFIVRVRRMISDEVIAADGEDAKEASQLASKLEKEGIDTVWLLTQRKRVRQIRGLQVENQSKEIAKSLQDQTLSLDGFVVPIRSDKGRLTEFFLVPTYAACNHEDPPPRLQVVLVSSKTGIVHPGRRTPVRVTGRVTADAASRTTVNAGGPVDVHAAYAMSCPKIEISQPSQQTGDVSRN